MVIIRDVKQQMVIRTYTGYGPKNTAALTAALNDGWIVVMANPIGNMIEYILEKNMEVKEEI